MINYTPPPGAEWLANAVVFYVDLAGKIMDKTAAMFRSSEFKTTDDLRAYARSIEKRDPSLARDLIAAANRHDDGV